MISLFTRAMISSTVLELVPSGTFSPLLSAGFSRLAFAWWAFLRASWTWARGFGFRRGGAGLFERWVCC